MRLVFLSVILNIHQVGVADELYRLCGDDFRFIQTGVETVGDAKGGTDYGSRPYLLKMSETETEEILRLINEADVVVFGAAPLFLVKERIKQGKLTFWYAERWLKKGWVNLLSPQLLKQQLFYHRYCHDKPVYALCASAYAAHDYRLMHSFKGKCFKWGYFTAIPDFDIEKSLAEKSQSEKTRILWVARFIDWKHPEVMIELAKDLHEAGYNFEIEMIGIGPLKSEVRRKVESAGLQAVVIFPEPMPNEQLLEQMRSYHIFCFTSSRREGWGAVLGEAMAAGVCPVASIECGSTPYLVENEVNGLTFKRTKQGDLVEKVKWLIDHPQERNTMSLKARRTMAEVWSPRNAARKLYELSSALLNGKTPEIAAGPCSKA